MSTVQLLHLLRDPVPNPGGMNPMGGGGGKGKGPGNPMGNCGCGGGTFGGCVGAPAAVAAVERGDDSAPPPPAGPSASPD